MPRDRCIALSNTKTNKTNDTKTSCLILVKTTLHRREKETNILNSLSLSLEREKEFKISSQTRTSKTVNRSFSLAFFRHKFNTFVPNASASDASFAFDICSLLFYGDDDERRVISLSRKSECLKFQILSSSRRDEFSTRSLSLFFLSADREVYVYKTPLLKRRERREKESAGCYFQLSLSSVCFCAWCVYSIAQREE